MKNWLARLLGRPFARLAPPATDPEREQRMEQAIRRATLALQRSSGELMAPPNLRKKDDRRP